MRLIGFALFVVSLLLFGGVVSAVNTVTIVEPQNITYYTGQNITWYVLADFTVDSWQLCFNDFPCVVIASGVNNITSTMTYPVGFYRFNFTANDSLDDLSSSVIYFTVLIRPLPTGINATLTEAGQGLGTFLDKTRDPLVNIILGLGFIGGIVSIILAVAYAFFYLGRKSVSSQS